MSESELAKKALGPHIFDRYIELKRKEWDDYRVQLTGVGARETRTWQSCRKSGE